ATPGSPEFAQQLGAALSVFVRQGVQHAKLELNPGDMGPLTLQIRLDGDRAQVHMAAEHSQTRQALEQSMPQLAGSLREAGLTLAGGGVFEQPPRQPPLPADWEERSNRARPESPRGPGDGGQDLAGIGGSEPISLSPLAARRGVVDLVA
ncbi:MAG: flagellar hook-length control protein FliK, partial [Pseudomonadota bacterium]|nr:flagellar hook-length control protein FliK [Pseudomonadota bacterium]